MQTAFTGHTFPNALGLQSPHCSRGQPDQKFTDVEKETMTFIIDARLTTELTDRLVKTFSGEWLLSMISAPMNLSCPYSYIKSLQKLGAKLRFSNARELHAQINEFRPDFNFDAVTIDIEEFGPKLHPKARILLQQRPPVLYTRNIVKLLEHMLTDPILFNYLRLRAQTVLDENGKRVFNELFSGTAWEKAEVGTLRFAGSVPCSSRAEAYSRFLDLDCDTFKFGQNPCYIWE